MIFCNYCYVVINQSSFSKNGTLASGKTKKFVFNGIDFSEFCRDFEIINKLNNKWLNISSAFLFTSFNLHEKSPGLEKKSSAL